MSALFDNWKSDLPEAEKGGAKISKFEVSEIQSTISALRGGYYVPPGIYTSLTIDGSLVMSDTPSERNDHRNFIFQAEGDVLINGLGMGCCLSCILPKPAVTSVTVIEINQDVIDMVAPHFPGATIIHADCMIWQPPKGVRYGAVWHDIWETISEDNLPEMRKLHRRYGRRCDWQGSWAREALGRQKRHDAYW